MYTVTLTAMAPDAHGRAKQSTAVTQPETPWVVSAYGRPTPGNLARFVAEWERKTRRALRVTRAMVIRRKGHPKGIVALYPIPM